MRCLPLSRTTFALALLFPATLCVAQAPESNPQSADEQRTAAKLPSPPSGSLSDQPAGPSAADKVSLNIIDQKLALSLAVDTWAQIETGELALKTLRNESLRQVISARVAALRSFAVELDALTEGRTGQAIAQAVREIEQDAKSQKARAVAFRPLALNRSATAMIVRIRLEILQEYTDLVQAELASKSGDEFDKHYLRNELLHQMQMLAMLQVFESQASADFAGVIHEAAVAAQDHLSKSRQTLMQLETLPLAGSPTVPSSNSTTMP